jgi:DNA invertase Pin-like site-specific DNA recombinase
LTETGRNQNRGRTQAGLTAARARNRKGGRPQVFDNNNASLPFGSTKKAMPVARTCMMLGIFELTLYADVRAA